jgi:hypothetical protein
MSCHLQKTTQSGVCGRNSGSNQAPLCAGWPVFNPGPGSYLRLLDDEVEPRVIEAVEPDGVVWSPPSKINHFRYRLTVLINQRLRLSFGS